MTAENKRKGTGLKTGGFLLLLFVILYVPSLLHWIYGSNIGTEFMRIGTLEEYVNTNAVLVRDEVVLTSPYNGKYISDLREGDRIPSGYTVATVLDDASEKMMGELSALDLRIIEAQNKQVQNLDIFSSDIVKLKKEITVNINEIIAEMNRNDINDLDKYRNKLDSLLRKKSEIAGSLSPADAFITQLKDEKETLQAQIKASTKDITFPTPGIISYTVDGYEELLNPAGISSLTYEQLESLKIKEVRARFDNVELEAGKPFAKIIKGIDGYLVAALDPEKAKVFKEGDRIGLRMNDIEKLVDGVITYKSEVKEGKILMAVRFDQGVNETAALRKLNVDLIERSCRGLKVPLKSLQNINIGQKKAEIFLVKANCASKREVSILAQDENYAIIESLKDSPYGEINLYDIFIVNPENIQEEQVVIK